MSENFDDDLNLEDVEPEQELPEDESESMFNVPNVPANVLDEDPAQESPEDESESVNESEDNSPKEDKGLNFNLDEDPTGWSLGATKPEDNSPKEDKGLNFNLDEGPADLSLDMNENKKKISFRWAIAAIVIVCILAAIWLSFTLGKKAGELEQRIGHLPKDGDRTTLWGSARPVESDCDKDDHCDGVRIGEAFLGIKELKSGKSVLDTGEAWVFKKDGSKEKVSLNIVLVCRAGCFVKDVPGFWNVREFSAPTNAHYNYSTDQKLLEEELKSAAGKRKGGDNSYFTLYVAKAGEVIDISQLARELEKIPGAFTTWSESLVQNYP